ncbi:hypothetical protein ACFE04_000672 [Oxalis oulophora]
MDSGEQETASSLIEQLGKAILELESHKSATGNKVPWIEIEQHFRNLETMLKIKTSEIEAKEKEYEDKEAEVRAEIAEREAVVFAKEQEFLDRVQGIKDAAVLVIAEERSKHVQTTLELSDEEEDQVSSFGDLISQEVYFPHKNGENAINVEPRPEIMHFCQEIDSKGLLNFAMQNIKEINVLRIEISVALESVTDPARLVLGSLEGFYPPDKFTQSEDNRKKDPALLGLHKSCAMLIEALAGFLAKDDTRVDYIINPETKQQAKGIADEWKRRLDAAHNSLETEAFLQLIATFRIASEFDNDELCKLVITVAHHSQAPELCRNLGLTHKMPGIVELLIANGKELEAVRIIHYFELTEMFPTVPILKQYLKDLRRNSQGNGENYGDGASAAFVNGQELGALRAVIWCINEFKLEAEYPLEPLEKRVFQLERSKIDKRSAGRSYKTPQPEKRPRPNGRYRGSRSSGGGSSSRRQPPPVYGGRPVAYNGNRYPHSTPPDLYNYAQVTAQPGYAPPQPNDQRMYYYPPQDERTAQYNATPPPTNYSYLGGGTQPLQLQQPYM